MALRNPWLNPRFAIDESSTPFEESRLLTGNWDINVQSYPCSSRADNKTQITDGFTISAILWLLLMLHRRRAELQAAHACEAMLPIMPPMQGY